MPAPSHDMAPTQAVSTAVYRRPSAKVSAAYAVLATTMYSLPRKSLVEPLLRNALRT